MKKNWRPLLNKLFNFTVMFSALSFLNQNLAEASKSAFQLANKPYDSRNLGQKKNYMADEAPHGLETIKTKENMGEFIDLDLEFKDEKGQSQPLKSYFQKAPVLMTVVYYNCPSLCNFHLNGLFSGLNTMKRKDYQFVVLSMDTTETFELAKQKKISYLKEFQNIKSEHVHFLTGSKQAIQKLTDSLGFAFRWDEETQQFAHSPVAYTLSPKGMISRYLYGVEFLSQTLRLALLEAGREKIGNMIDRILLFCYRFNPKENKYSLYAVNLMKAGGVLIILALITLLTPVWLKERKNH